MHDELVIQMHVSPVAGADQGIPLPGGVVLHQRDGDAGRGDQQLHESQRQPLRP